MNDQSVGSGAGVRQFISRTVDFAASDVPMAAEEIAKVPQGVVQIPMTAGAIAVAYNHQGCELKLTQAQLAEVFLGRITNFRQLGCADKSVKVVHRSDGSGTTAKFTPLQAAALTNAAGELVTPTLTSEQVALASIDLGPDLTGSTPNPPKGYPIVTFSWLLLYKNDNGPRHEALRKMLSFSLSDEAQAMTPDLGFISLPPGVLVKARAALDTIKP